MASTTKPWIRADLERLPDDGNRYEVLDGELLVTPLPAIPHQAVAVRLAGRIGAYCDRHRIGFGMAPAAIPRGESELQPDISVILGRGIWDSASWADLPTPALVVEILSPSTRRRDLGIKRAAYLRWGIAEYWIVDTEQRQVTVVRPNRDNELVRETLRWQPRAEFPALEILLDELFA